MRPRRLPVSFILILAAVLGLLATRTAQAAPGCAEKDLRGNYLGNLSGTITGIGPVALQALVSFNGDGTADGLKTVLMTGTTGPTTFTSSITYTLDEDCSGTATIVRSTGQTTHYVIAVVEKGEEIHLLAIDPGSVVTGVLKAAR